MSMSGRDTDPKDICGRCGALNILHNIDLIGNAGIKRCSDQPIQGRKLAFGEARNIALDSLHYAEALRSVDEPAPSSSATPDSGTKQ